MKATTPASLMAGGLKLTRSGELRATSTAPAASKRTMDEVRSVFVTSAATWPVPFMETAGAISR